MTAVLPNPRGRPKATFVKSPEVCAASVIKVHKDLKIGGNVNVKVSGNANPANISISNLDKAITSCLEYPIVSDIRPVTPVS